MKRKERINKILFWIILIIVMALVLYPFAVMISGSFKTDTEMNRHALRLIPHEVTLEHFHALFETIPFWTQFMHSAVISIVAVVVALAVDGVVAYGFTRFDFKGKGLLMSLILATMLIPPQVLMVPQFQMYKQMHLFGTYVPLVIPTLLGATGIYLLVQIMGQVPRELYESATIDGCGEMKMLFKIAFPLSKVGFGIQGVLTFMAVWNDYMTPLIYLNKEAMYTLPLGLTRLQSFYKVSYGSALAGSLLSCIPVIIILSIVGEKYFVQGMMVGAVKG